MIRSGNSRCCSIRRKTDANLAVCGRPEGKHHPKRIWFFEMLRRRPKPEALPESLAAWFQGGAGN